MQIKQSFTNFARKHLAKSDDYGVPQNREMHTLLASTAAGAAVGTLAGGALGFQAIRQTESLETTPISDPVFEGYDYGTWAETTEHCIDYAKREGCYTTTDGYHHYYTPRYTENIVGTFEKPSFEVSGGIVPVVGAIGGATVGGLIGIMAGVTINALKKSSRQELPPAVIPREKDWEIFDTNSKIVSGGFWTGAVGGTAVGALLGRSEVANTPVETRTYTAPVTVKTEMGLVPERSFTRHWTNRADRPATEPVYRDLPQYDANGDVLMAEKTEDFTNPKYGPWKGALYGGVIGGITGLALGTTAAMLNRISHYESPKQTP